MIVANRIAIGVIYQDLVESLPAGRLVVIMAENGPFDLFTVTNKKGAEMIKGFLCQWVGRRILNVVIEPGT